MAARMATTKVKIPATLEVIDNGESLTCAISDAGSIELLSRALLSDRSHASNNCIHNILDKALYSISTDRI